jgi:hypothetical protein
MQRYKALAEKTCTGQEPTAFLVPVLLSAAGGTPWIILSHDSVLMEEIARLYEGRLQTDYHDDDGFFDTHVWLNYPS